MQTHGVWPGPPAEPWAPASSPRWSKGPRWGEKCAWGVGRRIHKYGKPWGADPPQAKLCLTGWPQERALPWGWRDLSPAPTSPTLDKNPSEEIEGVAFSSLASIRIENDASSEETFLLGPPLTKKYLLGERELSYFNYSKYAKGILRGIYRLLLTICILRLLKLRQIFCFEMNV